MIDAIYHEGVAIVIILLNALSFITLAFVIVIYILKWKQINAFPMRLSLYLCISCIIQNLYVFLYPPILVDRYQSQGMTSYCVFQSWLKTTFDLSSILWTSIIIFSSFASIVWNSSLQRLQYFYLCIAYLLPIIVSLVPIFFEYYGFNVYFCWFNAPTNIQFWLKMGYYFLPLWVLFFLECYWAIRTLNKLHKLGIQGRQLNIFKKLLLFPLILLVTGIFPTIDLIYFYSTNQISQWVDIISFVTISLYGLFTALAYGLNPLIRNHIMILLKLQNGRGLRGSHQSGSSSTSRGTQKLAELITM